MASAAENLRSSGGGGSGLGQQERGKELDRGSPEVVEDGEDGATAAATAATAGAAAAAADGATAAMAVFLTAVLVRLLVLGDPDTQAQPWILTLLTTVPAAAERMPLAATKGISWAAGTGARRT